MSNAPGVLVRLKHYGFNAAAPTACPAIGTGDVLATWAEESDDPEDPEATEATEASDSCCHQVLLPPHMANHGPKEDIQWKARCKIKHFKY